jgi:hypothetical protein
MVPVEKIIVAGAQVPPARVAELGCRLAAALLMLLQLVTVPKVTDVSDLQLLTLIDGGSMDHSGNR